jgi:hypothetical protein
MLSSTSVKLDKLEGDLDMRNPTLMVVAGGRCLFCRSEDEDSTCDHVM